MRDYTKCMACEAIFPTDLTVRGEDDESYCPVCGDAELVGIKDVDVESVLDGVLNKPKFVCKVCGSDLLGMASNAGYCLKCSNTRRIGELSNAS